MKAPRPNSIDSSAISKQRRSLGVFGRYSRRQGQWEQSRALYAQAVELDPQNIFLLTDAALTDLAMRDAVAAQKHLGRARDLSPQNSTVISFLAQSFLLGGDIAQARALLDTVQPKPAMAST